MKVIFAIFVAFALALSLVNGASTNVDQRVDVIGNKANATENKEQCAVSFVLKKGVCHKQHYNWVLNVQ